MTSQTGTNDDRSEFKYVGKFSPVGRQSYDMAKGVTKYSRDMTKEDMLCAKALKSPYAHAKVEIVDTSGAEALEGVALVLRWDDEDFQSYPAVPGSIPLLSDIANYEGDECGVVVVARTENICRKALDLIQVNWIVLPHIMDPRKAAAEGAPLMRPELNPESNIGGALFGDTNLFERGDVAQGFEEADHIIEYDVSWPNMEQFRPMPPAYLAYWEKAPYDNADYEDYLYVNGSSNSGDTGIKGFARQMMGIPRGRVRPTTFFSGGTYCNYSQQRGNFLTPYLSKRVGKPVRYPYGRRDEFFFCPPQNYHHGKIGFTDEGVITTAQMHLIYQQGVGYGQRLGYIFSTPTPDGGFSVTSVPNLWVRLEQVYTNGSLATTEPGPRTPDVSNVGFTRVAEVLGMDPIDVVLANIPENGQLSLRMCIEAGKKAFNWDEKYHAPGTRSLLDGRMHGAAILVAHQGHGSAGTRSNMNLALKHDGKVYLPYSDSIIGTYWPEMYQLVIAEETGMKPEDVIVHYSENYQNFDPCGSNEHATNGTYSAKEAAVNLKRNMLEKGFALLGAGSSDEVDVVDSMLVLKADPTKAIPVGSLGHVNGFSDEITEIWGTYDPITDISVMNIDFCEVAVDTETGEVEILDYVMTHDFGKVFRPASALGQTEFHATLLTGVSRFEEAVWDKDTGVLLNGNALDYKIPTRLDVTPLEVVNVESRNGIGAYGAVSNGHSHFSRGLTMSAVANAIGVWVESTPLNSDKVLRALGRIR